MSSYATLLENYDEEHKYANVTFEEMANMLDSLNEFANEEVEFKIEISLQEAADGTIKDKAAKVGAALEKGKNALIAKLQAFITKIGEAIKAFVAKAGVVLKQGGNVAMKKIANSDLELKKEIKLTEVKGAKGTVDKILSAVSKAVNEVSSRITNDTAEELPQSVKDAIEALGTKLEKSDVVANNSVKNQKAKDAYRSYVQPYLVLVDELIKGEKSAVGICKSSQADAKKMISELKKNSTDAERIARLSKISTALMQLASRTIMFANSLLTIPTKNAAKIALAAGAGVPGTAKDKTIEGAKKAKEKAKEAKDSAKTKAAAAKDAAKAKVDAAKAAAAEKKAAKAEAKAAKEAEK